MSSWGYIRKTEQHREGCSTPEPKAVRMSRGDDLMHCGDCGSRWIATATNGPVERPAPVERPRSGYACRPHHESVNLRGQGCTQCHKEQQASERDRLQAKRERARRRRLNTEANR